MTSLRFTKIDTDADGIGVYGSLDLTESGIRAQVWRAEPGSWRWSLAWKNGHELPADEACSSRHDAMRAASTWWSENGRAGIDSVRKMHLGEWRRFLVNTSDRTKKATLAQRRAEAAKVAAAQSEATAASLVQVIAPGVLEVMTPQRGPVAISVEDDRLAMTGASGRHSVLLDYDCGTGVKRDRALIHLAGFMRENGAGLSEIASALAHVECDAIGVAAKEPQRLAAVRAGIVRGLARVHLPEAKNEGRGERIARLVAWHVGITDAPVLA